MNASFAGVATSTVTAADAAIACAAVVCVGHCPACALQSPRSEDGDEFRPEMTFIQFMQELLLGIVLTLHTSTQLNAPVFPTMAYHGTQSGACDACIANMAPSQFSVAAFGSYLGPQLFPQFSGVSSTFPVAFGKSNFFGSPIPFL